MLDTLPAKVVEQGIDSLSHELHVQNKKVFRISVTLSGHRNPAFRSPSNVQNDDIQVMITNFIQAVDKGTGHALRGSVQYAVTIERSMQL